MSADKNKELITRFITEIWNENKLDTLDSFLDPDYYDYTYEPRNRKGLEQVLAYMQAAFPGHKISIEEIVAEGDTVAVCHSWQGTHTGITFRGIPATNKAFEIGGYRFFKVKDGKITSHRGLIDITSMLQQIGEISQ